MAYFKGLVCMKCPSTCASCYLDEFQTVRCSSCSNPLHVIQIGQCVSSCLSQFYPEYKGTHEKQKFENLFGYNQSK